MRYFKIDEFKCPCCGQVHMNKDFLEKLDESRAKAGIPFRVTSGYRCEKHNMEVGGKPTSAHLTGHAADIYALNSRDRYNVLVALIRVGFKRIGIAHNFIHVDNDPSKAANVIWTY